MSTNVAAIGGEDKAAAGADRPAGNADLRTDLPAYPICPRSGTPTVLSLCSSYASLNSTKF